MYRDADGTCQLSQEDNIGNHWSLLVINITEINSYYGDSLSWPLPCNLKKTVKTTFDRLSADLNININECLDNISILNSSDKCQKSLKFYPLQTCSNMCGIIVVCMVRMFCKHVMYYCCMYG